MLGTIVKKIIGTKNDRELKRMGKLVETINSHGEALAQLSDADLQLKTREFRQAFQDGKTLDELLPEAFAVVREAFTRVMGLRHFDVQMVGGIALHEGRISEMRTGEGKTLTATLAAYLNALSGEGVHVVTVNDYLAERDANWMRPLYEFLGLSVGVILSQQPTDQKREAYAADITYGTNNEYGFDYLRDNMAFRLEDRVQRGLNYAIVDEVDSILIDEARTPLIISGPAADSSELYVAVNRLMPSLSAQSEEQDGDFFVDEKQRQVELTEDGHQKIEALLVSNGLLEQGESLSLEEEPAREDAPVAEPEIPAVPVPQADELASSAPQESADVLGDEDDFDFLGETDENATKLDLAKAYIDMGDTEGARDILNEVISEGNDQQQAEARELMSQVG